MEIIYCHQHRLVDVVAEARPGWFVRMLKYNFIKIRWGNRRVWRV